VKEIVVIGSSSELALEFTKLIRVNNEFKIHTISSESNSKPTLFVDEYLKEHEKISKFIAEINIPYVIFFNGFLKENRPNFYPNTEEILKTFRINYKIPIFLTIKISIKNKNAKFIYISSMAAVKYRDKNYIYGIAKALLETKIKQMDINYLIFRFGKIKTKMSESHGDPPFTLSKSKAAFLILKLLDKEKTIYPTNGLKIMSIFLKVLPVKILNFLEKIF
jgi:short-subunit dehydrogenase